ncbi:LysE family transporter [Paraglaciecola aquimarina]|uniref:LysE family transporter n=1 Tax=Paraglaciecola aquimarina TaxID=1235557 RepID=A0ABU3SXJ3_9ALTE|nr:LysE family transporter [Paraglaciecola aquimarina]MDU0354726.1 LysE family transporter [Paraglaciecola aquimarina]
MLYAGFQGVVLGLSMIVPIGAQNSHVLSQGIKRHFHLLTATVCILCDVILINIGIFGGAKLLSRSPLLISIISWAGMAFLVGYAGMSFRSAWQNNYQATRYNQDATTRVAVLTTTLAITLLNPHVYLDTVVILGSVGGQFNGYDKVAFAVGTMLASIIWFYCLATAAATLSPWLNRSKVQRIIDCLVGCVMCVIAYMLYQSILT